MDVKEAVASAKRHVADAFADETIEALGLEEVRFDEDADCWVITLGFSRSWAAPKMMTTALGRDLDLNRTYKAVRIRDADGQILSMTDRFLDLVDG